MRPHFEKVTAGEASFRVFERSDPEFAFCWHYHPEFELTLILDSEGQRLIGDGVADYFSGDLVLLGPNVPHSWRSGPVKRANSRNHRAVVIQFRPDFLGEQFFSLREMEPIAQLLRRSSSGLAFGHTSVGQSVARNIAALPAASSSQKMVTLLSILLDLAGESSAEALSAPGLRPVYRVEDQKRVDKVCSYLTQRFREQIDFTAVAREVHMDQASLCRFFKRATGRTMTTYVNELRVGAAVQLLRETERSILDIGFSVGFGNYANFNRQFNRIKGFGPRQMRRQFAEAAGRHSQISLGNLQPRGSR